jgi:hypothetical protein
MKLEHLQTGLRSRPRKDETASARLGLLVSWERDTACQKNFEKYFETASEMGIPKKQIFQLLEQKGSSALRCQMLKYLFTFFLLKVFLKEFVRGLLCILFIEV